MPVATQVAGISSCHSPKVCCASDELPPAGVVYTSMPSILTCPLNESITKLSAASAKITMTFLSSTETVYLPEVIELLRAVAYELVLHLNTIFIIAVYSIDKLELL